MCGLAGIAYPARRHGLEGERLSAELERLAEALGHRGPDARGIAATGDVGLAHTRLAILDLSASGAQPMWSPDRRHVIVYNGEVYNFPLLSL